MQAEGSGAPGGGSGAARRYGAAGSGGGRRGRAEGSGAGRGGAGGGGRKVKVVAVGSLKDRVQLLAVAERCWEAGLAARAKGKIRATETISLCIENSRRKGGGCLIKAHSEERDRSGETRAG